MSSVPPDDDRTIVQPFSGGSDTTAITGPVATTARSAASSAGESGNALPNGTCLGEFELTGVLGEGGFGIVYTAQDQSLQRRVALKEYMPSALASRGEHSQVQVRSERYRETFEAGLRSFVNEARLLAQFDHPSLVKVYRFWEANGTAYMVMPLYEGVTLKDKLKRLGARPDETWLMAMLAPLTEALAVIHAERCYHRDIAPDNVILLAGSERPLLLDFGAARRVISDMTQALTVILKPGYAPVEQYAEVPLMKQGAWTDVYALAATVHYAVTGKTPPPAVARLMNDTYQPLAAVAAGRYSPGFLQAIDRALQVKPVERTPSVAALRADLGLPPAGAAAVPTQFGSPDGDVGVLRSTNARAQIGAPSAPEPAAAAPPGRGGKGLILAGLAALLVGGGVAAFVLSSSSKPAAPTTPDALVKTAPQATPPRRGFEIREEFDKVIAGQMAEFKVRAAPLQKTLRIGRDKLAFDVSSSRAGYVHVLVLGPDGSLLLLFPNAQSSDNAIKAGQTLRLPQDKWLLDTSEPAGPEDFLVIVSAQPRDYSELSKDREFIFLKLPTGQRGAELAAAWTRSTPLLLGGLKNCPSADCESYGAASFSLTIEH